MMTTRVAEAMPIGAHRLSCLPCRKRKQKCDRVQPCSSCVLRNTEKFCYTNASVDDVRQASSSSASVKSEERERNSSNGQESPSNSSFFSRPAKVRKTGEGSSEITSSTRSAASAVASAAKKDKGKAGTSANGRGSGAEGSASQDELDRSAVQSAVYQIKATLSTLQDALGHPEKARSDLEEVPAKVTWDEVRSILPSKVDCETILDCFSTECQWLWPTVHSARLLYDWHQFADGQPTERATVALAMFCMGATLYVAPSSHPASRLPYQKNHRRFVEHGHQILFPTTNPFATTVVTDKLILAQLALCYYMSMNGWLDQGYLEHGKLLRFARCIELFDESRWDLSIMSDWDIELRRRLATIIKVLERWTCLHMMRLPVVPLVTKHLPATFYPDECYDIKTGALIKVPETLSSTTEYYLAMNKLCQCSYKTIAYLLNFLHMTPTERYDTAREIDALLQEQESLVPNTLQYATACNLGTLTSPEAFRTACQSLILYCSFRRLRCTVMRQFLLDREAPVELRVAALEQAKCLIEVVPVLIAISSNPWCAFNSSWCSGHLFNAASTFAFVYLGEDDHHETSSELDWFASKIFQVLDTLSVLSAKDRVAKRSEELLTVLCTGRDTLRKKYAASSRSGMRNKRQRSEGDGPERKSTLVGFATNTWPSQSEVMTYDGSSASSQIARHIASAANANTRESYTSQNGHDVFSASTTAGATDSLPSHTNSSTGNGNGNGNGNQPFQASPEALPSVGAAAATPAAFSSSGGSRASQTENDASPTSWLPSLDEDQWSVLINSLNGDWASMNGGATMSSNTFNAPGGAMSTGLPMQQQQPFPPHFYHSQSSSSLGNR